MTGPDSLNTAVAAIRATVKSTWAIPNGAAVPETATGPIPIVKERLPMAALEVEDVDDGRADSERGSGLRNSLSYWRVHCWLLRSKKAGQADLNALRSDLSRLRAAFESDDTLAGSVTTSDVLQTAPTGQGSPLGGRVSPFEAPEGTGVQAGFVTVEITLVES